MAQMNRSEGNQGQDMVARMFDPFRILQAFAPWQTTEQQRAVGPSTEAFVPVLDVREQQDRYVIAADLPGVRQDEVEVTAVDDRITISGRRKEDRPKNSSFRLCERPAGEFSRTITLPPNTDSGRVEAELKDGVLKLEVPKRPEAQRRRIDIGGAKAGPESGSEQSGSEQSGGEKSGSEESGEEPGRETGQRASAGTGGRRRRAAAQIEEQSSKLRRRVGGNR
jgi:HSP20 family protein